MDLEELKYPIGKYNHEGEINQTQINEWISTLEALPKNLRSKVENLSYDCLNWSYRPKGWMIKQLVHHLADSHMNSLIRFKLVMTEDDVTIKPYNQDAWSSLPDGNSDEIQSSINILDGVHQRVVILLNDTNQDDWNRTFVHPEYDHKLTLGWMIGLYAWHCKHHLAHIDQAIKHEGKFEFDQ